MRQIWMPTLLGLAVLLAGCGQDEAENRERPKSFGAGLGETYKGMMDEARQTTDQINAQMDRTERAVRERNE